jgi:hypothetical protein
MIGLRPPVASAPISQRSALLRESVEGEVNALPFYPPVKEIITQTPPPKPPYFLLLAGEFPVDGNKIILTEI